MAQAYEQALAHRAALEQTLAASSDGSSAADAARHGEAVAFLHERCTRVVCLTAPLALGRPPVASDRLAACNEAIRDNAQAHGALVVSLSDFGARNQVMADHVHPTAFGQIAIAERALAVLGADGVSVSGAAGAPRGASDFGAARRGDARGARGRA